MNKNFGLTNTEMQIMELLWSSEKPMSFREIMNIAVTEWKKTWKVQTLNTFFERFAEEEADPGRTRRIVTVSGVFSSAVKRAAHP